MKSEIKDLRTKWVRNDSKSEVNYKVSERVRQLEDLSRNETHRITGLTETAQENPVQSQLKLEKLVFDQLKLENITVKFVYSASQPETNCTRTIIARL